MCIDEPKLDQLLTDPMVRLVMASDGVKESEIRTLAKRLTHSLGGFRNLPARLATQLGSPHFGPSVF